MKHILLSAIAILLVSFTLNAREHNRSPNRDDHRLAGYGHGYSYGHGYGYGHNNFYVSPDRYHYSVLFRPSLSMNYVPGYWATKTQEVLVEPARIAKIWIEPKYDEMIIDGKIVVVKVRDGYFKETLIPARYETTTATYFVPGRYVSISTSSVGIGISTPSVSIGLGFRP